MSVSIILLGSVSVTDAAGEVSNASSSQLQLVVAKLVLEREHGTARDALADALWARRDAIDLVVGVAQPRHAYA